MLNGKDIFKKRIEKVDFVRSLRDTQQNVLSGSKTLSDLLATDLYVNHPYTTAEIKYIFDHSKETQRERVFPRQQLCNYMGMTEHQYKELDVDNHRRDAFFLIQRLFKDARWNYPVSQNKIPHMLLIEELVNTLNTQCIGKFLYDTALAAVEHEVDSTQVSSWLQYGTYPDKRRLFVLCHDTPNTITVRAEYSLYPYPQPDMGIKVRLAYDVTVEEDRFISYQNIHAMVIFPRTNEKVLDQRMEKAMEWEIGNIRKKVFEGRSSLTQYPDPEMAKFILDYDIQKSGFVMDAMLLGKTFAAQSILKTSPQEISPQEYLLLRNKNRDIASSPEDATKPKTASMWNVMSNLFSRVVGVVRKFFSYIKNLLFSAKTDFTKSTLTENEQKPDAKTSVDTTSCEVTRATGITDIPESLNKSEQLSFTETGPESAVVDSLIAPQAAVKKTTSSIGQPPADLKKIESTTAFVVYDRCTPSRC